MAPAVIEIPQEAPISLPKGPSDYKETFNAGPKNYRKETEEKGNEKHPPAKYQNYLPTWDPEKK